MCETAFDLIPLLWSQGRGLADIEGHGHPGGDLVDVLSTGSAAPRSGKGEFVEWYPGGSQQTHNSRMIPEEDRTG